ncbi:MAG: dodecin domain-containing protein [Polyangiales bacterium]
MIKLAGSSPDSIEGAIQNAISKVVLQVGFTLK